MSVFPKIKPFGEHAVLLEWSKEISQSIHLEVMNFQNHINKTFKTQIVETVPAYCSLAVYLKYETDRNAFIAGLSLGTAQSENVQKKKRTIYIPVCYDLEFGVDLPEMSQQLIMPVDEIIKRHKANEYTVYFLGFLPGFPYLGGLDPVLTVKRKQTPKAVVSAGSVGIAGNQTGIYTMDSPGGWNIIGRSPLQFFDVSKSKPNLIQAGDSIRFFPISKTEFQKIEMLDKQGNYRIKTETTDV
jgi:inhibitor of KinA